MSESGSHCNKDDKEIKKFELMFDIAKRRYDSEVSIIRDLDGKAHNSVGYVSVLVGLLLGSGSLITGGETLKTKLESLFTEQPILALFYFGGIALLLLSIGFALYALKVRAWPVIDISALLKNYEEASHLEILKRNTGTLETAVKEMEANNDSKAVHIQMSWILLIIGLILVFLAIVNFSIESPIFDVDSIIWFIPVFNDNSIIGLLLIFNVDSIVGSLGVWIPLAVGLIVGLIYAIASISSRQS